MYTCINTIRGTILTINNTTSSTILHCKFYRTSSTMYYLVLFVLCFGEALSTAMRVNVNGDSPQLLTLPSNATSIREEISDTFVCDGREYGYYADVDNGCQIFHVCLPVTFADGKNTTFRWSFICPEETIFNQEVFTCTREEDSIKCEDSPNFYSLNNHFGMKDEPVEEEQSFPEEEQYPEQGVIEEGKVEYPRIIPVQQKQEEYIRQPERTSNYKIEDYIPQPEESTYNLEYTKLDEQPEVTTFRLEYTPNNLQNADLQFIRPGNYKTEPEKEGLGNYRTEAQDNEAQLQSLQREAKYHVQYQRDSSNRVTMRQREGHLLSPLQHASQQKQLKRKIRRGSRIQKQ